MIISYVVKKRGCVYTAEFKKGLFGYYIRASKSESTRDGVRKETDAWKRIGFREWTRRLAEAAVGTERNNALRREQAKWKKQVREGVFENTFEEE